MDQFRNLLSNDNVTTSTIKPSISKVNSSRSDSHSGLTILSADEKFFVLMAAHYGSQEAFENFLLVYQTIVKEKLISKVNSAIKSSQKYWTEISHYCDMSKSDLKSLFEGSRGVDQSIHVKAAQRSLWNAGQPAVCIGFNPTNITSLQDYPEVAGMFGNINNIIKGFETEKLDTIKNVLINIMACAQNDIRDRVKTRQDRIMAVKDIVSQFTKGRLPYALSPSAFKAPKEPGVALPHTMGPRDWLGTMVTALVEKEFSADVLVVFRDGDVSQTRQFRDNKFDYLLVSPDEDSAYSISNTPALYAHGVYTEEGLWEWRSVEERVKKRVAYELSVLGYSGQQQSVREEMKSIFELEEALSIKGDSESIQFINDGYFGVIPDDMAEVINKKYCLRFYGRGFSKPNQVKANPSYLHICKSSIIPTLTPGEFYPITLPDLHSVVLFPKRLWDSSVFAARAAKNPKVGAYRSAFGIRSVKSSMNNVQLFLTLYQLSHVFEMYDCWYAGKTYDHEAFSLSLKDVLAASQDKLFSQLFHPTNIDLTYRGKIIDTFCSVALGAVKGMWLAPSTSSLGKEGLKDVQSDAAFSREMDNFEMDDYDSMGTSSNYDFGSSFGFTAPETINFQEGHSPTAESSGDDEDSDDQNGFDFFDDSDMDPHVEADDNE